MTQETGLRIRSYGDAALRRRARPLASVTAQDRQQLAEMWELMRSSGGIGLAAPQVGLAKQMLVIDIGEGPVFLINPRLYHRRGSEAMEEGCLSLPGVYVKVRRATSVRVNARNEKGEPVTWEAKGLMARVIQHEVDHLRGRLIIDHANLLRKFQLKKQLKNLVQAEGNGLY